MKQSLDLELADRIGRVPCVCTGRALSLSSRLFARPSVIHTLSHAFRPLDALVHSRSPLSCRRT
jgi:hypothetical protein